MLRNINKSKILLTGANGFIGSHLLKKIAKTCLSVVALIRSDESTLFQSDNIKYLTMDLKNKDKLESLLSSYDFDMILHLAASADVKNSVDNPIQDFKDNVITTLNLLEIAKKKKVKKFIFPSTVSIYSTLNRLPIKEKSFMQPSSPYGAAKLACESYCFSYFKSYGLDINIVRIFNVYGPGVNKLFIYDILKKISNDPDSITMLGNGLQVRDYLYIDDVVDGILLVASKGDAGEDYNLCSGKPIQLKEIIYKISNILNNKNIDINTIGDSYPGDIEKWYGDNTKIRKLGFSPKISMDEGLKKTIKGNVWLRRKKH